MAEARDGGVKSIRSGDGRAHCHHSKRSFHVESNFLYARILLGGGRGGGGGILNSDTRQDVVVTSHMGLKKKYSTRLLLRSTYGSMWLSLPWYVNFCHFFYVFRST